MTQSKYEKYIIRKPAVITNADPKGIKFEVPAGNTIPMISLINTGPRLIFSNDMIKEAGSKIEYGFIIGDTTLLTDKPNYGAHKHDYAETFLFFGNNLENNMYPGG